MYTAVDLRFTATQTQEMHNICSQRLAVTFSSDFSTHMWFQPFPSLELSQSFATLNTSLASSCHGNMTDKLMQVK